MLQSARFHDSFVSQKMIGNYLDLFSLVEERTLNRIHNRLNVLALMKSPLSSVILAFVWAISTKVKKKICYSPLPRILFNVSTTAERIVHTWKQSINR